jgi:hypothetical protein
MFCITVGVQTILQILCVFCEITTVAVTHGIANKDSRGLYRVQRESCRGSFPLHTKHLSMLMRERSALFKEAVDCCDFISSTVDEEMGAEQ